MLLLKQLKVLLLRRKIKKNPLLGIKQPDNAYHYKDKGYTFVYRINELPSGKNKVEWLYFKRRLTAFEEKALRIKKRINSFFLYQRWLVLFRFSVVVILISSLTIFYFGIREHSIRRIERFKWVLARISGIDAASVEYSGGGWFSVSGQKTSIDKEVEPVTINFNPTRWFLFSDSANVSLWSEKLNRHVNYSVRSDDKGDVWLAGPGGDSVHGKVRGDKIVWDKAQRTGIKQEVSGHRIAVENGKLKILDE